MSVNFSARSTVPAANRREYSVHQSYPVLMGLSAALMTGAAIVYGKWIHLAGIGVICLLMLWPLEVALGTYSLLLPFDSISVVGNEATGTTLTWVVGGVAGAALVGTGILQDRFQRPPRAALWWALYVLWGAVTTAW